MNHTDKFCCKDTFLIGSQQRNSGRKPALRIMSEINSYVLWGFLIKCTVAAASGNTRLQWHLCLPSHCSSWGSTLGPSLKMLCDGHFSPLPKTPFETRRVIMIIQLLITFTYIRTWGVEQAVCMHDELIKVGSIFHIFSNILLIEALVVPRLRHKPGASLGCRVIMPGEIPGNSGKTNRRVDKRPEFRSTQPPLRRQQQTAPTLPPSPLFNSSGQESDFPHRCA